MSLVSTTSSYYHEHDPYESMSDEHNRAVEDLSQELSHLSLDSEESLRRFQNGELAENDQEWHRLVPPEARDALGKQEVQRQSVIFEVFKGERDYVADLEAIEDVFIKGLEAASPPIIPPQHLTTFIDQVFGNLNQILVQHQRLLGELFARQREQHPLVQSVADLILDAVLGSDFRSAYDTYIKHYRELVFLRYRKLESKPVPALSESFHRTELKRNVTYRQFMESVSSDPRIRKRDLITFISRPVTRLPRLNLVLEQILKLTDKEHEHPDLETLPIINNILNDFVKSTQPGILAAESKVKFWQLCECLLFQKGELFDLDLYDDNRTLVYSSPVTRLRSEPTWPSQSKDLTGSLLDHYFLLTRDEKKPNSTMQRNVVSRPLFLSYLRLGSFTAPPEIHKAKVDEGSLLDSFRTTNVTVYPFTIYHASNKNSRRYTFYVASEKIRKNWYSAFVDALAVHKARQEGNMTSNPVDSDFHRVFTFPNPAGITAIGTVGSRVYDKFIIHTTDSLFSYSLDAVAQAAQGKIKSSREVLETMERVAKSDLVVAFFKHVQVGERQLIMFTSKKRLQTSLDLHVVEVVHAEHPSMAAPKRKNSKSSTIGTSFKPFGEAGYVTKDAFDIFPLTKTAGICTDRGIVIVDPTNLSSTKFLVVPDLSAASSSPSIHNLKARLEGAKPLGLVPIPGRSDRDSEILVVYDTVGCYVTRQGKPCRSEEFIKWETKATSFAHRGNYVFLISPMFIEIRSMATGLIVQVIEGMDIRLLNREHDEVLIAMRGNKDDKDGISEMVAELTETAELPVATPVTPHPTAWDEWDMEVLEPPM
ncbi:hypothetical protein H0H92_011370 [Tricholoma furcatifolium]|nr:hypothetical protein H0H92_011370 [Tricholoma furcatifolium]